MALRSAFTVSSRTTLLQCFLVLLVSTSGIAAPVSTPWTQAHAFSVVSHGLLDIFSPKKEAAPTPTSSPYPASTPEPVSETPAAAGPVVSTPTPAMIEPTPTPAAEAPSFWTPEPNDNTRSAPGASSGTAATSLGGISFLTLGIIAIAIIVPAFVILMVVRRRSASTDRGFENMPATTQAHTYSGEIRRNDNFSVGDE